jgi:hypothetical protein
MSEPYEKINFDIKGKDWWRKVTSLIFRFRERCKKAILSAIYYSIDELLEKFEERLKHTLQIDTKAAEKDYKIYILNIQGDYLMDYKYISKITKIAEIQYPPGKRIINQLIFNIMTALFLKFFRKNYASYLI